MTYHWWIIIGLPMVYRQIHEGGRLGFRLQTRGGIPAESHYRLAYWYMYVVVGMFDAHFMQFKIYYILFYS